MHRCMQAGMVFGDRRYSVGEVIPNDLAPYLLQNLIHMGRVATEEKYQAHLKFVQDRLPPKAEEPLVVKEKPTVTTTKKK